LKARLLVAISCAVIASTWLTILTDDGHAATLAAADSSLAQVEAVTPANAPLSLKFATPFVAAHNLRRVLAQGSGAGARRGQRISFDYVVVDGRTGKTVEASPAGEFGTLMLSTKQTDKFLVEALAGSRVGSQVLVALGRGSSLAQTLSAQGVAKQDTLLFLFRLTEIHRPLARATGVAQPPGDPALFPTVKLSARGGPAITMPANNPPAELQTQVLIKGAGPVVEAGNGITVHYAGVIWRDGKVFDSTWRTGKPADFTIGKGAVIPGWDSGLVGQTVGSQVLLIVPPAEGYGDSGNTRAGITPTDTLVFVVDILDRY
jgi:peptidylprolyl isomerase